MVQEIQSVLEALVVPGMQNKPENVVKEPVTLHCETPALRERQMSTKIWKGSYFHPKEMPQSVRRNCVGPSRKNRVWRDKNDRARLTGRPVQLRKAPQT